MTDRAIDLSFSMPPPLQIEHEPERAPRER
jgi:hypothetical protein